MAWWDWIASTARKIGTAIETGLRGIIELPEELEPYIPARPATLEQIEEALADTLYADRFIEEALPDEARRLVGAEHPVPDGRGHAVVRTGIGEVVVEVVAAQVAKVAAAARVGVVAAMQDLVGRVHHDEAAHEGEARFEARERDGRAR